MPKTNTIIIEHETDDRKPTGYASGLLHSGCCGKAPQSRSYTFLRRLVVPATAFGMLGWGIVAHAQVRVEGKPDAVHIEVGAVPLRHVLDVLQANFNMRYRTGDALAKPMTGNFNGSLHRIIVRLLDDYDFAMKVTPEGIDVLIIGPSGSKSVVPALPAMAPATSRSRVMTAQEANRYERENRP
ncbi:hypothetical protein [Bradyrhizobium genosp. P]|uniref:hypothetical protein n=1 Tax=Bradyrhizobium genosp. P TaxID=83641 RepID=UPI003CF60816